MDGHSPSHILCIQLRQSLAHHVHPIKAPLPQALHCARKTKYGVPCAPIKAPHPQGLRCARSGDRRWHAARQTRFSPHQDGNVHVAATGYAAPCAPVTAPRPQGLRCATATEHGAPCVLVAALRHQRLRYAVAQGRSVCMCVKREAVSPAGPRAHGLSKCPGRRNPRAHYMRFRTQWLRDMQFRGTEIHARIWRARHAEFWRASLCWKRRDRFMNWSNH